MPKRKVEGRAGPLVVIGGAEDREESCEVLREFVRLAGGARARIAIISVASDVPKELDDLYEQTFRRLGAREVHALDIRTRGDANGEVAEIMRGVINVEAPWLDCSVVLCEEEALRRELKRLGSEEIVVMFYDKREPLMRVLAEFKAEPVETLEGLAPRAEAKAAAASAAEHAAPSETAVAPLVGVRRAGTAPRRAPAQDWQGYIWR